MHCIPKYSGVDVLQFRSVWSSGVGSGVLSKSVFKTRSRSGFVNTPEFSGVDQSTQVWMELRSRIRSSIGVGVGFQNVESEWSRESTPEFPSLDQSLEDDIHNILLCILSGSVAEEIAAPVFERTGPWFEYHSGAVPPYAGLGLVRNGSPRPLE
uniref:Uncharacterized protein n=1 Tax=Anopheles culicifacies TaxID=139723 RepID=A0A182MQN7_9DIPT